MGRSVYITGGKRTAIGAFGGSLAGVSAIDLGSSVIKAALEDAAVAATDVDQVVLGNVIHTEPRDMYISRVAALNAGIPKEAPALTVNRLCGSGLQAIVSASQSIMLGDAEIAVAGGAESMSRSGHLMTSGRWGQKMGDTVSHDMMLGALHDPFGAGHMGVTAENVAARYQITREDQDAFALESHRRASEAIRAGRFKGQITPISVRKKRETVEFDQDEHVRMEAILSDMEKLRPVFQKDGTVTAGNASGVNDGAAAIVLVSEQELSARDTTPRARIVAYGHAGVEPSEMGIGPIPATQKALQKAGLTVADLDVVESNEAFAAQACAVTQELGLDPAKVNPNGGAVALGHPVGATGAIITVKLLNELERIKGKYGLATMCIGGGQGIALVVERVD